MKEGQITLADGRTVGFADYGTPDLTPVLWCHGGLGCRYEPDLVADAAERAGLRLVGRASRCTVPTWATPKYPASTRADCVDRMQPSSPRRDAAPRFTPNARDEPRRSGSRRRRRLHREVSRSNPQWQVAPRMARHRHAKFSRQAL